MPSGRATRLVDLVRVSLPTSHRGRVDDLRIEPSTIVADLGWDCIATQKSCKSLSIERVGLAEMSGVEL